MYWNPANGYRLFKWGDLKKSLCKIATPKTAIRRLINKDIPAKVTTGSTFQNARKPSDKQIAVIEHDKALARVIVGLMQDDTELFKQFSDNELFRRWLKDTVFGLIYADGAA